MSFGTIVSTAINNIGVSFEWVMLILIIIGSFIFFAKDFKVGMMILLVTAGGLFIWFYQETQNGNPLDWTLPLSVFFMALVILALSLFAVNKNSATGGFT